MYVAKIYTHTRYEIYYCLWTSSSWRHKPKIICKKNMTQFFMMIINLTKSTVNNSIATIIPHQ